MELSSPLLQSCLEDAAQAARSALDTCIDDAVAALQIAETQSDKVKERVALADASRELLHRKTLWLNQYPHDLLAAFEADASDTARAALEPETSPASNSAFQSLLTSPGRSPHGGMSMVADDDVSQAIEASRLLQQILPVVEPVLTELDKLIGAAQGLGAVRRDLNPLRPEVFTQALREMMFAGAVDPGIISLWIRCIAPPLGRELKRIYERVINRLEMAQVQGLRYRVLQTPASATGIRSDAGGGFGREEAAVWETRDNVRAPTPSTGAFQGGYVSDEPVVRKPSQLADLSDEGLRDGLFRQFLHSGSGGFAERGLAPAYYDNIEAELRALKGLSEAGSTGAGDLSGDAEAGKPSANSSQNPSASTENGAQSPTAHYRDLPAVERPTRAVHAGSQLSQKLWGAFARRKTRALVRTQLSKDAQRVSQVLGLEAVRKMVDQVAQDPRLLAPVREAIIALEPSLLRLAMHDPRFITDQAHPAPRLMERVAQRSFKYNDEFSPEFTAFFAPVALAFNGLNSLTIEGPQPFAQALADLERSWNVQDREEASKHNAVLQALRFAEARQARADSIARELSRRTDLAGVPPLVQEFLFGPWSLVMAHARQIDSANQVDPGGFGSAVPDLIWSTKRNITLKQPGKLIDMIPGLLNKLHEGLNLLGKSPDETVEFFESLMALHQPVLKLRRRKSLDDAEESGNASLSPEYTPDSTHQWLVKEPEPPWLARAELDAAGFEETAPGPELLAEPDSLVPVLQKAVLLSSDAGAAAVDLPANRTEESEEVPRASSATRDSGKQAEDGSAAPESAAAEAPREIGEDEAEQMLSGLRAGDWVDLYVHRRWLRAELVWTSDKGTLFMFVSNGGRPHSMTRRICERLLRDHLLRPVARYAVVGHAFDAVASAASLKAADGQGMLETERRS